ncbi:hypothetical protein Zmor_012902 [Zophobas morio]|uniref:Uncharacterized protein n=1 Tax=Zophobas morio TaxID=2755281 RepID=A0AA38MET1_9CUCU|nr:hypothetical protein Zmor_012902 [Zophobas morio]
MLFRMISVNCTSSNYNRTGQTPRKRLRKTHRCNVTRDFIPGCFNRYIFVLAEVDARIASAEEVLLDPLVPRHRYSPVVLVATIAVVVPASTAAATAAAAATSALVAGFVPAAAASLSLRLLGLLPTIITGQVTLPFLIAATASTPIISLERLAVLEVVTTIPAAIGEQQVSKLNPRIIVDSQSESFDLYESGQISLVIIFIKN